MFYPEHVSGMPVTYGEALDTTASDVIRNQQCVGPNYETIANYLFVITHPHLIFPTLFRRFDVELANDQNVSGDWCPPESFVATMRAIDAEKRQSFK